MKFAMFFLGNTRTCSRFPDNSYYLPWRMEWTSFSLNTNRDNIADILHDKNIRCDLLTMWLRDTVPRVRIDQLLNLGWKIMIPLALLNLLVAAFAVTTGVI